MFVRIVLFSLFVFSTYAFDQPLLEQLDQQVSMLLGDYNHLESVYFNLDAFYKANKQYVATDYSVIKRCQYSGNDEEKEYHRQTFKDFMLLAQRAITILIQKKFEKVQEQESISSINFTSETDDPLISEKKETILNLTKSCQILAHTVNNFFIDLNRMFGGYYENNEKRKINLYQEVTIDELKRSAQEIKIAMDKKFYKVKPMEIDTVVS